jgi:hypothetical protein
MKLAHFIIAQIQQLVKFDSSVGEGTKGPLFLGFRSDLRVRNIRLRPNASKMNADSKKEGDIHHFQLQRTTVSDSE